MALTRHDVANMIGTRESTLWTEHIESMSMVGERRAVIGYDDLVTGVYNDKEYTVSEFRITTHDGGAFTVLVYGE